MTVACEFHDDPAAFLAEAGEFLAARPVASTVVSVVTQRIAVADAEQVARPHVEGWSFWWLVVREGAGRVVGAAMRTAPFAPYPPYLLEMPDEAAIGLARRLHERGEPVGGINGALPATRLCAQELARLSGRTARVIEHTRLFELGRLQPPPAPPGGGLRAAREDEVELVLSWYAAFGADAAAQAGRTEPHRGPVDDRESMLARIRRGDVWLWEAADGTPVHVSGCSAPSFGVCRIGPVYTPAAHRGHGYASAAVAELSRVRARAGARVCLFTDQANPTSNRIYTALGYRPVEDQANFVLE